MHTEPNKYNPNAFDVVKEECTTEEMIKIRDLSAYNNVGMHLHEATILVNYQYYNTAINRN